MNKSDTTIHFPKTGEAREQHFFNSNAAKLFNFMQHHENQSEILYILKKKYKPTFHSAAYSTRSKQLELQSNLQS